MIGNGTTAAGSAGRRRGSAWRRLRVATLAAALAMSIGSGASANDEWADDIWEALTKGKPILNIRGRIEVADAEPLNRSAAYTIRTRLGYGTKPYHGVRAYMDFENIAAASLTTYFIPTMLPNLGNKTPIADPPTTEVNQVFLEINRPDWLGTKIVGGRQRIVYDDSRFIGDVIWRQNQQTYDAAHIESSLGVDPLKVRYGYLGKVRRIFGGGGNNPSLRDFNSNSHIVNASFDLAPQANLVAFAYLLDLSLKQPSYVPPPPPNAPNTNSSKTFGLRISGAHDLTEKLNLGYVGSYAYQSEFGPYRKLVNGIPFTSFDVHYYFVEASLGWAGLGRIGAAYEELGSDAGLERFQTPLATLHKFNGFADVFLNNGGPGGLRDFYAFLAPKLPWGIKAKLIYHRFWSDSGGAVLGNEYDAVISKGFGKHFSLLFKGAYFVKGSGAQLTSAGPPPVYAPPTTWRIWFDATIKF